MSNPKRLRRLVKSEEQIQAKIEKLELRLEREQLRLHLLTTSKIRKHVYAIIKTKLNNKPPTNHNIRKLGYYHEELFGYLQHQKGSDAESRELDRTLNFLDADTSIDKLYVQFYDEIDGTKLNSIIEKIKELTRQLETNTQNHKIDHRTQFDEVRTDYEKWKKTKKKIDTTDWKFN